MNARQCLGVLLVLASRGTNDVQEAVNWMVTNHPDLGMRSPVDCDYNEVTDMLNESLKRTG